MILGSWFCGRVIDSLIKSDDKKHFLDDNNAFKEIVVNFSNEKKKRELHSQ
ncbi:hypothetical protein J4481_00925 [Candidatus Pacearchaeota archaeon]|nr:hypothetical protein [Candidatus Pacearchaeota archaeon]